MSLLVKLHPNGDVETKDSSGGIFLSGHGWRFERARDRGILTIELGLTATDDAARILGQQPGARAEQPELAAAITGLTKLLREKLP